MPQMLGSRQTAMAFSRNDSEYDDIFFVDFMDDSEDLTRKALTLHSHANGQETQQNTEETCNA